MKLQTFSPEDVVLTINDYRITDFASGSYLKLTRNSPFFRQVRGIRGKNTRVRTRDRSGELTLRLLQTSPQNDVLSDIVMADEQNQTALLNVVLRDVGGTTGIQLGNAYIAAPSNKTYRASETFANEWKINYDFIRQYHVGGNEKGALDFLDNIQF